MKSTKINTHIQSALAFVLKQYPIVGTIYSEISRCGGRTFLVGGAVRDILLGLPIKDIDIEVHGMPLEKLENLLKRFGPVSLIGKSFGVLRYPGLDIDWSIPRIDTAGRKPMVKLDPSISLSQAFSRRDLTINAMGIDMQTGELIDPFDGKNDLKSKILRAPNVQFFQEDPLRLFRVMQFISRFEMVPDQELTDICRHMDIRGVSQERIEKEFNKMLLKSKRPSLGLRWLKEIGRLAEILPELAATVGVGQQVEYHPEGDVFEHTMQTVDAAARFSYQDESLRLILLYAALCHDLGKVITTHEEKEGELISLGHAQESYSLTKAMLRRITGNNDIIQAVATLVKYHMAPIQFIDGAARLSAYKRLAKKSAPHCSLALLTDLALADKQGRNPKSHIPYTRMYPDIEEFRKRAQEAMVLEQAEPAVLHGGDIADIVAPGPEMGKMLTWAYQIQLEEGITDKNRLKERVVAEWAKKDQT